MEQHRSTSVIVLQARSHLELGAKIANLGDDVVSVQHSQDRPVIADIPRHVAHITVHDD